MFGYWKEKNVKKNDIYIYFLRFGFTIKNNKKITDNYTK